MRDTGYWKCRMVTCVFLLYVRKHINSPSVECDSEEEDILGHSYPCSSLKQQAFLRSSSGEERDSFDALPDLNCPQSSSTQTCTKVPSLSRTYLNFTNMTTVYLQTSVDSSIHYHRVQHGTISYCRTRCNTKHYTVEPRNTSVLPYKYFKM